MLSQEIIAELKTKYGEVYVVSEGTKDYVFRPLLLGEFLYLSAGILSTADAEDYAVRNVLVWPENADVDRMKPGTISSIAVRVLELSAFTNPKMAKQIFEEKRDSANDVVNVMKALILACFPELGITETELNTYTFAMLAEKTALAEKIVQIRKTIYDPGLEMALEIIDPEELAEADKRAQEEEFRRAQNPHNIDGGSKAGTARADDPIAAKLHAALGHI